MRRSIRLSESSSAGRMRRRGGFSRPAVRPQASLRAIKNTQPEPSGGAAVLVFKGGPAAAVERQERADITTSKNAWREQNLSGPFPRQNRSGAAPTRRSTGLAAANAPCTGVSGPSDAARGPSVTALAPREGLFAPRGAVGAVLAAAHGPRDDPLAPLDGPCRPRTAPSEPRVRASGFLSPLFRGCRARFYEDSRRFRNGSPWFPVYWRGWGGGSGAGASD